MFMLPIVRTATLTMLAIVSAPETLAQVPAAQEHVYSKASSEEARRFLLDLAEQGRIPDLPPIYLKHGERWDTESAIQRSTPQGIHIDQEDWIVLWAVVPTVSEGEGKGRVAPSQILQKVGEEEYSFLQNGILVSTVDLEYVDGEVVRTGPVVSRAEFLPKGEYVWYIGRSGVLLTGGRMEWDAAGGVRYNSQPTYWLKFKEPLRAFPTGTFVLLFELMPLNGGFRIGPEAVTILPLESTDRIDPMPILTFKVHAR